MILCFILSMHRLKVMSQIEKLREFIDISVKSKSNHKFFEIEIPSATCIKIEKILGINLNSYRFVIKE